MTPIPSNPILGVSYHSAAAFAGANCYAPQKYIKRWSWETFWIVQAAWCWLLWPIVGAICTIPSLGRVLTESPKLPMLYSFLMSMAFGVGGIAFNLSIRYIGFSLTYAIAIGLSAVLGTLIPPLVRGQLADILAKPGAEWVIAGVVIGALGIAICGAAGRLKEGDLKTGQGAVGEFSLLLGLLLSLVAGVLSAVYNFAIEVTQPIIEVAARHGAGQWQGNVAYLFANSGAFVTSLFYCSYLVKKNRSLGELVRLSGSNGNQGSLLANYFLAMITGTLWYAQFLFYNLGHVRMGQYAFTSWALQMILLVLFSNLLAVFFREWKGCRLHTQAAIGLALAVLLAAILLLTYGNYLGDQTLA
jgi:L-rhamnose-H+ transport protein